MDPYLQLFIYIIIITPVSLLWHELGHVLGARIVRASHVTLTIGIGNPLWERTFQNITFIIRKLFLFNSLTETKRPYLLSRKDKVVITFMGPMNSLLLGIIAYAIFTFIMPHLFLYSLFL